jgi:hypothetical protein
MSVRTPTLPPPRSEEHARRHLGLTVGLAVLGIFVTYVPITGVSRRPYMIVNSLTRAHRPVTRTGVPPAHERCRQQIRTARYTELPDLCASADIAEESPARGRSDGRASWHS